VIVMQVLIGFESMFGNTHRIANAIASGFAPEHDVTVTPITDIPPDLVDVDVLVVGAPTHAHTLPRRESRRSAVRSAHTRYKDHQLEPTAERAGVREWLAEVPPGCSVQVAAYDTRFRAPGWLVGHPATRVSRALARRGATVISRPQSFYVDKHEQLHAGEVERAQRWGAELCRHAVTSTNTRHRDLRP
jgi:hypothetical protein